MDEAFEQVIGLIEVVPAMEEAVRPKGVEDKEG